MAEISQTAAAPATGEPATAPTRPAKSRKWVGYLAFLPFLLVIVGYELLPLAQLVLDSLIGKESGTLGIENFVKVFTTPLYQQSIINSVWISLVSAVVGIVVSFLAARFAYESSERVRSTPDWTMPDWVEAQISLICKLPSSMAPLCSISTSTRS